MDSSKIETGCQLFTRIVKRPDLGYTHLFEDPPRPKDFIQITGNDGSGKTMLVTDLIARCILPKSLDFNEARAVVINADHHFSVLKLSSSMRALLASGEPVDNIDGVIEDSLSRLIVLNCYDGDQLAMTIKNLEKMLNDDLLINFVAIDSLNAYYWGDKGSNDGFHKSYHLRGLIWELRNACKNRGVVIAFADNSGRPLDGEVVEFVLLLTKLAPGSFQMSVQNRKKSTACVKRFKIGNCLEFLD